MKLLSDWRTLHNALTAYQSACVECRVNRIDPHTALMYRDGRSVLDIKHQVTMFDSMRRNTDKQRKLELLNACIDTMERGDLHADERARLKRNARWLQEDLQIEQPQPPTTSRFHSLVIRLYRSRDFLMRVIEIYYRAVSMNGLALCRCCDPPVSVSMSAISKFARSTMEWMARAVAVLEQRVAVSSKPLYDLDLGFDELFQQIIALQGWRHVLPMYVDDVIMLSIAEPFFRKPSVISARRVAFGAHVLYEAWHFRRPSNWNKSWIGAGPSKVPWGDWPMEERAALRDPKSNNANKAYMLHAMGRSVLQRSMSGEDWGKLEPLLGGSWCLSEFYRALKTFYDKYKHPVMRM